MFLKQFCLDMPSIPNSVTLSNLVSLWRQNSYDSNLALAVLCKIDIMAACSTSSMMAVERVYPVKDVIIEISNLHMSEACDLMALKLLMLLDSCNANKERLTSTFLEDFNDGFSSLVAKVYSFLFIPTDDPDIIMDRRQGLLNVGITTDAAKEFGLVLQLYHNYPDIHMLSVWSQIPEITVLEYINSLSIQKKIDYWMTLVARMPDAITHYTEKLAAFKKFNQED